MSGRFDAETMKRRLRGAWSSASSSLWSRDNPARGQCSVTALAVQRLCGGEILKTPTPEGCHFYNSIGGSRVDLTAEQFESCPTYEDLPSDAEEAMSDTSPEQLAALMRALEDGA